MSYLVERTIGNAPFDQYHVGAIDYMGVNQPFRYCIAKIISTSKPRSWVQHLTPPNGLHSEAILDMFCPYSLLGHLRCCADDRFNIPSEVHSRLSAGIADGKGSFDRLSFLRDDVDLGV